MVNKTNQVMGSMDMSNTMSSNMTMTVISNSGGRVLIQSKISNVQMTGKNPAIAAQSKQLKSMLEGATTKVTMDSFGTPIASATDSGNAMLRQMMSNMGGAMGGMVVFPKAPVHVGTAWTATFDMAKMLGSMMPASKIQGSKIPIRLKVLRFESRAGKRCAILSISMSGIVSMAMQPGQTMSMQMSSTGTSAIDIATGMTVDTSSASVTKTSAAGQSFTIRSTATLKQI
jgi:hypothetical protein